MAGMMQRLKIRIKIAIAYVFYLPGLIMHEGAHALAAILTFSKITAVNLVPSINFYEDGRYKVVYGYVNSVARIRAAYMVIGAAPLFLLAIPIGVASYNGWVDLNTGAIALDTMLAVDNAWFVFMTLQVFWGCIPSSQDIKVFFHGMISPSGLVITAILIALVYYGL